ncbi:DUF2784 domain-containing protein [Fodinibius sp.]|uniref:DUF2784 domain-containing protein n=1 Tax=Fodinibius sp. TaxID=1872440 RepID=UPI002ACD9241|nr:DUF2784 domain-containing protein [Fodinibius sp.]MDZ7658321.1 DUF2784 domain-containing protein [Fodinibius sp.]
MYILLDIGFIVFHTVFILFNLFGWMWKATRPWNLATLLLTAFSWFILGIWYGFGYCPCTDWHWQVRQELGYTDMPTSYIEFLAELLTGLDFSTALVDSTTAILFFAALLVSIYVNFRDFEKKRIVS